MTRQATPDEIATAARLGQQAWEAEAPRAPALSLALMHMLDGAKVGEPRNITLMRAWTDAYDALTAAAAAEFLAEATE